MSSKLEDGDIRSAIRLTASDDTLASFDDVTAEALRSKHPSSAASDCPMPAPNNNSLLLQQAVIMTAIKCFMLESAGGPDGLRPQHLKDLNSTSAGDAGKPYLSERSCSCHNSTRLFAALSCPHMCPQQERRRYPTHRSRQQATSTLLRRLRANSTPQ